MMASQRCDFDFNLPTQIATLNIKNGKLQDTGTYKVVGENIAGKAETRCDLKIDEVPNIDETPLIDPEAFDGLEKPYKKRPDVSNNYQEPVLIVRDLKDQLVNEGQPVYFECEVKGTPEPQV